MELQEFADVVLDCDILTKKESFDLVKYFSSVLKFPTGFSEATRPGSLQLIKMSRFGSITNDIRWHYGGGWRNSIVVSVDKTIKLHAVRLFGSQNKEYLVTLKVTDSNGVTLATKSGIFMSKLIQCEIGDYQGFDIVFETPVALQAGIQYSLEASISRSASGYGQIGFARVDHAGVTFYFAKKAGSDTTVSKGQFPELVFTVC
ncbi:uncharacterized protein LOC110065402 [Orbicella faveolata]|uniref:uncharacterized protein LOC110065402 n=1 Tax=Orbicella faveolata TaxID=48498 RepID=UPI0009E65D45|nr:uncharacterized protein LOC110065402 [Orbicella faveolata]